MEKEKIKKKLVEKVFTIGENVNKNEQVNYFRLNMCFSMKKVLFLCIVFLNCIFLSAQVKIIMEESGGVFKVPCHINGARMKLYFDTGASKVSLSLPIAQYLYENDYIKDSDFIGVSKTLMANGNIETGWEVNLRDVELGGLHLRNVKAVISPSLTAPLLLGQSAIQKLGGISMNGSVLIIHGNGTGGVPTGTALSGYKNFRGYIGGKYAVTMTISIAKNGVIQGSYYYDKNGSANKLKLSGKYTNGKVYMKEYNADGYQSGTFNGNLVSGQLTGNFTSYRGDTMYFSFTQR